MQGVVQNSRSMRKTSSSVVVVQPKKKRITPRQRQRLRHTATTEFLSQGRDIVARRAARGRVEKDEKCSRGL